VAGPAGPPGPRGERGPAGPPGQAAERESATSLDLMAEFAVLPLRIAMTMAGEAFALSRKSVDLFKASSTDTR